MKFLSILFTLYIATLMLAPAWEMIDFASDAQLCSTSCCAPAAEQPADNDAEGCNDLCNPFLSCGICLGFTTPSPTTITQPLDFTEPYNLAFEQSTSFQFIHSIWHPPKLG